MRDHIILNPQAGSQALEAHLRAFNLCKLKSNLVVPEHGGKIDQAMMPNSFPPKDEAHVALPLEGAKVDLAGHLLDLDAPEVGFIESKEDFDGSLI